MEEMIPMDRDTVKSCFNVGNLYEIILLDILYITHESRVRGVYFELKDKSLFYPIHFCNTCDIIIN